MKIVTKTGLVPVHTKADKAVFGVPPLVALKGVREGTLFLVDIPEDIETEDFDTPKTSAAAPSAASDDAGVAIPADWEMLHYAKQLVLAKQIIGAEELPEVADKKPVDVARDVIRGELERRAAPPANEPPAATPVPETPAQ